MRKLALITATAAIIASAGAIAVFAATPSSLDCQNAANPGNIGPMFTADVDGDQIKVKARGAYGFSSRLDKMYRYAATGQGRTSWTDDDTHTWQLPESGLGRNYKVTVWACAIKKKQPLKGQHHVWVRVPAPPTPTPVPPTRTPTPSPTPTPTPEAQDGIKSHLFTYVGWSGRIDGRRANIGCSEYDSTTQACPDDMPAPFMEQLRTAADQWDAVLDTENPVDLQILLTQNQTARAILIADDDGNPQKAYLALPYGCQNTAGFCGGKGLLVHELGHGLGMARNVPRFWDLVVDGKFTGEKATDAHQGEPVPMYNPGDGIVAHWGGSVNDIMSWAGDFTDPTISDVTIGAFSDIGYTAR